MIAIIFGGMYTQINSGQVLTYNLHAKGLKTLENNVTSFNVTDYIRSNYCPSQSTLCHG